MIGRILRWAFAVVGIGAGSVGWAGQPLYMVELAVFTCPHCKAVNELSRQLDVELKEAYVFAPIGTGAVNATELAWYAMRKDRNAPQLRSALFALQQDMRVAAPTFAEVSDWVNLNVPSIDPEALERGMGSGEARAALGRAESLVSTSGVASVPAFVFVSDGKVVGTLEKGSRDAREFVLEGLRLYRQLKGDPK